MNRPQVDEFFTMLGEELDTLGLRQSPQAIYNMDESGLHLQFRPGKVFAVKGDCWNAYAIPESSDDLILKPK